MAIQWNDPDNFMFPIRVLCTQQQRIKRFWDYFHPIGQQFEYTWSPWWQQVWVDRSSPNATIESYLPSRRDGFFLDPYFPGPLFRYVPQGSYQFINAAITIPGLEQSLLEQLRPKYDWNPLPSWQDLESALFSQVWQSGITDYPTKYASPGYYRTAFIDQVKAKGKIAWEKADAGITETKFWVGAGRVPRDPLVNKEVGDYLNTMFVAENHAEGLIRLWKYPCGCCLCSTCKGN